jgi:hypothetical protein
MPDEEKMYEMICSKRFDKIDTQQQITIDLIKGANGDPGLLDDVRTLKKAHKRMFATVIFIVSAVGLKVIHATWAWAATFF